MERSEINRRTAGNARLGALFVLVYAAALLPPVYIALSGRQALLAGVPVSLWYLILVSAAPIAVAYALWVDESRRGVLN